VCCNVFHIFTLWYSVVMKIGIMGAKGSFSEKAGEDYVAQHFIKNAVILPLISAETVLTALEAGEIDRGIFPIENSNGGIVIEAVHAMAKHRFSVERMFEIDVHHMLLVKPGMTSSHITAVTSHDQAIKQCRMYLQRVWPDAEISQYADTAKAAEDLGNGTLADTTAVIAPRRCAELYDLEILEESIQDLKFNYTAFVVAVKLEE
jgi:prephenate dehydratase